MRALVLTLSLLAVGAPARADVIRLDEGTSLAGALARAADGDEIVVPAGTWTGGVTIERSVTLRGEPGAVIDGGSTGTVLIVRAPDVHVLELEIRGSGNAMLNPVTNVDACIWVAPTGLRAEIARNRLPDCLFGIYIQRASDSRVVDNEVHGRPHLREADRGNGVQVFDADRVQVLGNRVTGARDGLYVAASDDCRFERNVISGVRYAIHYMWSHRNTLSENETTDSLVGFALMQSRNLTVTHNRIARNTRAGLLVRDGDEGHYAENDLVGNGSGLFVYNSIRERFTDNLVAHNEVGLRIWGAMVVEGVFERNALIGNHQQVFYFGNRDMVWGEGTAGNHFSDYLGWDQDDDGIGDRPYRVDNLTASLLTSYPATVLLLRSPALELLSHLEERLPVLAVHTVTDRSPLVAPPRSTAPIRSLLPEGWRDRRAPGSTDDSSDVPM